MIDPVTLHALSLLWVMVAVYVGAAASIHFLGEFMRDWLG
jgi:hypothetical protein